MTSRYERLLLAEKEAEGTIVSVICVIGWHGEPCDAAREQSASRVLCSCACHEVKA